MIYYLLYPLSEHGGPLSFLNVLRYVPFRVLIATATAMAVTFGLYPWFIRSLQKKQIGQVVRKEGPESHFSKAGTPTMGGALILLAIVISTVLWADPTNSGVWLTTLVTAAYGVVGWIDDARKITKKDTGGLSARWKLILQYAVALSVCGYLWYGEAGLGADWLEIRNRVALPFLSFARYPLELPTWAYLVVASTFIVFISNAVNLTDGLDGLAIGPVMMNAATYAVLAYLAGVTFFGHDLADYLQIPSLESAGELAVYGGAVTGAGFGFLWYNTYPAQVFMGDVGSLALGGGLAMLAVLTKNEVIGLVLGGIFVLEAASVITQVISFRLFGKRIFRMAPIHHHFEKQGWPEPKVIVRFWIISVMLVIATLASLKLR